MLTEIECVNNVGNALICQSNRSFGWREHRNCQDEHEHSIERCNFFLHVIAAAVYYLLSWSLNLYYGVFPFIALSESSIMRASKQALNTLREREEKGTCTQCANTGTKKKN